MPEPILERARILVAEDNLVNQQVALGLLRSWGCHVAVAANGTEALRALEEELPDLVLMDVEMPELDGLETTRRIRGDPRFCHLPVLALTASVLPEERQKCEEAGMNDYLPKPLRPAELKERLEYWLVGDPGPTAETGNEVDPGPPAGPEPGSPPVHLEAFREAMQAAGIESVVELAVAAYLEEMPGRMKALESAVAAGDGEGVRREAHGMKSGSRNLRADRLAQLLEEMEAAGTDAQGGESEALLGQVLEEFRKVLDFLERQGTGSE